jgi:protein-arginine kinase activator protein McsA
MFERFTDRARRVVVLAQEEAKRLDHNHIGTEHILLGLIREGDGVAAKALESLGISLDVVRQQVEELIGRGQPARSGHIPFTPRGKKVLELSLTEAVRLGHGRIGTEHILLGLLREGDGVAVQVLVKLGADLNRVRQQVIQLLHGHPAEESVSARLAAQKLKVVPVVQTRLEAVEQRLAAVEQRVGTGPDTSDLDEQIDRVRGERQAAAEAQDYEQAAALGDWEVVLLAVRAARQEQWAAGHPDVAEVRLTALEQWVGTGPDTSDLDEQIAQVCREKESAIDAKDYEQAASLRDREKQLLGRKAAQQKQWAAWHPALPVLAERCQQLADEIERLRAVLRQHGIDPQDKPA